MAENPKHSEESEPHPIQAQIRLIFHPLLSDGMIVMFLGLAIMAIFRFVNVTRGMVFPDPINAFLIRLPAFEDLSLPQVYSILAVTLLVLFGRGARIAFDIANDILHYIRFNALPQKVLGGNRGMELPYPYFQIRNRFWLVFKHLQEKHGVENG